jgi:CBS domain-containing protein
MPQSIREVMTEQPVVCPADTTIEDAARMMRDRNIGDVLVAKGKELCGIVTDRDLVVRGMAEGKAGTSPLGDLCSRELVTLGPDDAIPDAVELVRQRSIRRLPVVEGGTPIGVVSLGDLAVDRDETSVLAGISAAPANH